MQFKAGQVIGGRFQVIDLLGRGGVGVVYSVVDRKHDEVLALKVLKPEVAKNRLALERFVREAKAARTIDHKGITKVYNTGKIGEILFYTMDRVEGESIHALIKRVKRLELSQAFSLMVEICDIMSKIHEVAIHRDLSSDNIMIQPDGTVRILDLGTVRMTNQASDLTVDGMHLGKMSYSAPEQRIDSRSVDHRADVYSMGMLMYEMLAGETTIYYESVTQCRPDLGPEWDAFFSKALAQEASERYETAIHFRDALAETYKRSRA